MKIFRFIGTLFIISFSYFAACQTDPDAWEAHHTSLQPPEEVMNAINLKKGMIVGEIGAGRGRYAVILAKRVGTRGHIYANDINKEDLEYLKFRCQRDRITNLTTIPGLEKDPLLPENKLDMIFIVNTYHHISDQVTLLKKAKISLKKGGTLVIIEGDPKKQNSNSWHSTTREKLIGQMEQAGYKIEKVASFLVEDNIYIFKVR